MFYWQIFPGNLPDETPHWYYLIFSNCSNFKKNETVGSAGCDTDRIGRWDQYKRPTRQQKLDATVLGPLVCCDSAEYRSAYNSHDYQCHTYLDGATFELHAKKIGPAGLRDCECPAIYTDVISNRTFREKTDNITQWYENNSRSIFQTLLSISTKLQSAARERERRRKIGLSQTPLKPWTALKSRCQMTRWTETMRSGLAMITS